MTDRCLCGHLKEVHKNKEGDCFWCDCKEFDDDSVVKVKPKKQFKAPPGCLGRVNGDYL